jgi:hypothetical protein
MNVRSIIVSLKTNALERDGSYTDRDSITANQAFRKLFVREGLRNADGFREDEHIFGSLNSPFIPDGDIGTAPDYAQALMPGECHWCISKGLFDNRDGNAPQIFENPNGHTWPPVWNCDVANQPVPGRAQGGCYIIIGRNDGSINLERLASAKGTHVSLQTDASGNDLFTSWQAKGDFLDVEQK